MAAIQHNPFETEAVVALIGDGVRQLYGDRVERTVLYGSRAHGNARPDSDYDVALFLRAFEGLDKELDRTAALSWRIQKETGAVVSILPFPADAFALRNVAMNVIRAKGIAL